MILFLRRTYSIFILGPSVIYTADLFCSSLSADSNAVQQLVLRTTGFGVARLPAHASGPGRFSMMSRFTTLSRCLDTRSDVATTGGEVNEDPYYGIN